jgi:hypothetical protein
VRQHSLLAAHVLESLTKDLSSPAYSLIGEGKSNADFEYEYSYRVQVTATRTQLVMEFVFDSIDRAPIPSPMRVTVDEFENVFTDYLSSADEERVRSQQ